MLQDYVVLAAQSVRHRKVRSWLTMLGIVIGIAAVISLISLGEGLRQAITGQFASLGTDRLIVQPAGAGFGPPGSTAVEKLAERDAREIARVNGVDTIATRLLRAAPVEFHDEQRFLFLASLPEDEEGRRLVIDTLQLELAEGRMLKPGEGSKVVVGDSFATADVFPQAVHAGNSFQVLGKDFEVVGVLEKQGNVVGNDGILINEEAMKDLLSIRDEIDFVAIQVVAGAVPEAVAEGVERALRRSRDVEEGKEDFTVQTPLEAISTVNTILAVVQAVVVGIAAISLIVGGIGIMNTMYTAVLERKREIGVMKAIGARNRHILLVFLVESGMLGMAGGIMGVIIGVGFGKAITLVGTYALGSDLLQAKVSLSLVIGSLLFSFLAGTLSGLLPARQAASLSPVEAMRG
ncbi:MAG TPA: ABC transporter permease [Candidatus Nanoarchaeia archaeon]|nr:ABC transporter permease [Candidatus Nanoarchaeia archaeon]